MGMLEGREIPMDQDLMQKEVSGKNTSVRHARSYLKHSVYFTDQILSVLWVMYL